MASTSPRVPAIAVAVTAALVAVFVAMPVPRGADDDASAVFGVKLPADYRDWRVVSVAHEKGSLNDIRAILGNDIAMKAFRAGTRPFPDGSIIARLAWTYVPSDQDNAIFGQAQSFVAGAPTNVQLSVVDRRKYADTGGWGFGQFEDGRPNHDEALLKTCAPCHARAKASDDFVFTQYAR